jgi:hypothetical protein
MLKALKCSIIASIVASVAVSGCSKKADSVQPTYVSPLQYSDYDCDQVRGELVRVSAKVREVSGAQDKEAEGDAIATGVGLVLFWPALFFLIGEDRKHELGQLKGEYDSLQAAAVEKDCEIAAEIAEAERLDAARRSAKVEKTKDWEANFGTGTNPHNAPAL